MKPTRAEKLIIDFEKSGLEESLSIQLDNLDEAKLVYDITDGKKTVMVENEYGTKFPVSELSKVEIQVFDMLLPYLENNKKNNDRKERQDAIIQGFISQIEKDIKNGEYDALDELLKTLIKKKKNEDAMFAYLSDDIVEKIKEEKIEYRY